MGEVGFFYRSSVALGCLILMLASIACTGWFFYSWLGGVPGLVGAGVGCAVQLMAYGFSGVLVYQANGLLKLVITALIASALALSILSSYATLNGYFSALQLQSDAEAAAAAQKEKAIQAALDQRMQLMESMSRDVEISSEAADQGLSEKYRTQANQFLKNNESTRNALVEQIEKVEALAQSDLLAEVESQEASPIDGLSSVLGGQNTAIMVLCIWLALMFDALPIVGITLFATNSKQKKLAKAELKAKQAEFEAAAEEAMVFQVPEFDSEHQAAASLLNTDNADDPILVEIEAKSEAKEKEFKLLTNICSNDLQASKRFYTQLLGLETKYDSDWYVQLCSPEDPETEFGVIKLDHELVPHDYRQSPKGMYITFVVPDVNETYRRALSLGVEIIQEPRNEFYGQRRFLAKEPSGCLIDICSPWESEEPEVEEPDIQQPADISEQPLSGEPDLKDATRFREEPHLREA